jgi:hypothetical protein
MRHCLCAMLFSCFFFTVAAGTLTAGDLTTAQTQQLVSAAQSTKPGAKPSEATLLIDGKNVVFTVTRDAVGNVIARPIPGPDSAGVTISQVSIQMRADKNGLMLPASLVMVLNNQTIISYSVQLNPDGTIAKLHQAGTVTNGAGAGVAAKPVEGGIGGGNDGAKLTRASTTTTTKESATAEKTDRYPGFTSGQLSLPAGAGTGEVSHSKP